MKSSRRTIYSLVLVLWAGSVWAQPPVVTPPAVPAAAPVPAGPLEAVEAALALAEAGSWAAAQDAFLAAAALDPDDALAYVGLGVTELARRRANTAAAWFRRALASGRAEAVAQTGLGVAAFSLGDEPAATSALRAALATDAEIGAAVYYRALLALAEGDTTTAGDLLGLATAAGVPVAATQTGEALRQLALGDQDRARQLLTAAGSGTEAAPGLPWALPLSTVAPDAEGVVRLALVRGEPLGIAVAPQVQPAPPAPPQPAANGGLVVEQPLPGETVSGRVTIRASLLGAGQFEYVSIAVNGRVQAITNRQPFYAVWDTTQYADGPHEITVRAVGPNELLAQLTVNLRNRPVAQAQGLANPYDLTRYKALGHRLGALMIHRQPPAQVDDMLLEAILGSDPAKALPLLEQMIYRDPEREQLTERVVGLYARQGIARDALTLPQPTHGVPGQLRVALTFDDGPRPGYTEPILSLLAQHNAKATFLVTGIMSERYPDLLRQIDAAGHEIGSHTYNHFRLNTLSEHQQIAEMVRAKVAIDGVLGKSTPRLMRPPGGHFNPQIRDMLAAVGYWPVFWTINCGAYASMPQHDAAAAIMAKMEDGAILLLHNGPDNTLDLLPALMHRLRVAGYKMVTASEIVAGAEVVSNGGPTPIEIEPYATP